MNTKLGYELKQHRRAAGLTRFEVAQRTGYSLSYIIAIEKGGPVSDNATTDLLKLYFMAGCIRDAVDDYAFAIGEAGNLGGVEIL